MDSLYDALNVNDPELLIDAIKKGLRQARLLYTDTQHAYCSNATYSILTHSLPSRVRNPFHQIITFVFVRQSSLQAPHPIHIIIVIIDRCHRCSTRAWQRLPRCSSTPLPSRRPLCYPHPDSSCLSRPSPLTLTIHP